MVYYLKQGDVPRYRHTFESREKLYREELFGEESFDGSYSLIYHRNEPTRIKSVKEVPKDIVQDDDTISHRLLHTDLIKSGGDFVSGKKVLIQSINLSVSISKPTEEMKFLYSHGIRDQLIFVHRGRGSLISVMGRIDFKKGDYIYIPKGLIYRMEYFDEPIFLLIESKDGIQIPLRYLNRYGQIKEGVPYYTRDIRPPVLERVRDRKEITYVWIDFDSKYVVEERDTSPFDVEGWDGYHYPFAISTEDMMPVVGKVHQPPPVHESFSSKTFMVATFLPRKFDFHERAIPISYYHSNVDTDELLFYSSGNFMSRKGVREGSITLHVRGLVHGPQPGAIEESLGKEGVDEVAVMVESYLPLHVTKEGTQIEDKNYMMSWYK
ncbi:MAG: homogentisate 1,2-dioxygenase [Thermoplasmatales archaeon]